MSNYNLAPEYTSPFVGLLFAPKQLTTFMPPLRPSVRLSSKSKLLPINTASISNPVVSCHIFPVNSAWRFGNIRREARRNKLIMGNKKHMHLLQTQVTEEEKFLKSKQFGLKPCSKTSRSVLWSGWNIKNKELSTMLFIDNDRTRNYSSCLCYCWLVVLCN